MKFLTVLKVGFVALVGLASTPALALGTAIDLADVILQFGEITTAIVAVGGLILTAAALYVSYGWVKKVMGR